MAGEVTDALMLRIMALIFFFWVVGFTALIFVGNVLGVGK